MTKRKLLVTSALPYANGSLHLGHLVEYIQTDIWVRYQRLIGNECMYVCASDTHGTPIMLNAQKKGIAPDVFIENFREEHQIDFKAFGVAFDYFGSTNSPVNKEYVESLFKAAVDTGAIYEKEVQQLYSEKDNLFLPDRFVKGRCPRCEAADQYGDSCEACSAIYTPEELVNPYSVISGDKPILKSSRHYFFKVSLFEEQIKTWLASGTVSEHVSKKMQEWFDAGLKDWDISRDAPYFGFKIPGETSKFFYVWMDAPVGYLSSTHEYVKDAATFNSIWKTNDDVEVHHFIGKDIMYFHTLFWPAMLSAAAYRLPTKVNVHGFLTVNGFKMSKSRGTFITARQYVDHLDPELLRYYYASKLNDGLDDIDLNLEDFVFKVNSDVLGKLVNIGSRLGAIVCKKLEAKLSTLDDEGEALLQACLSVKNVIEEGYESRQFAKVMKQVMILADKANQYIDRMAPWSLVKEDTEKARMVCTVGLNMLKILSVYLIPVLPRITTGVFEFLNCGAQSWNTINIRLENQCIQGYQHLASRLEKDVVGKLTAKA